MSQRSIDELDYVNGLLSNYQFSEQLIVGINGDLWINDQRILESSVLDNGIKRGDYVRINRLTKLRYVVGMFDSTLILMTDTLDKRALSINIESSRITLRLGIVDMFAINDYHIVYLSDDGILRYSEYDTSKIDSTIFRRDVISINPLRSDNTDIIDSLLIRRQFDDMIVRFIDDKPVIVKSYTGYNRLDDIITINLRMIVTTTKIITVHEEIPLTVNNLKDVAILDRTLLLLVNNQLMLMDGHVIVDRVDRFINLMSTAYNNSAILIVGLDEKTYFLDYNNGTPIITDEDIPIVLL